MDVETSFFGAPRRPELLALPRRCCPELLLPLTNLRELCCRLSEVVLVMLLWREGLPGFDDVADPVVVELTCPFLCKDIFEGADCTLMLEP